MEEERHIRHNHPAAVVVDCCNHMAPPVEEVERSRSFAEEVVPRSRSLLAEGMAVVNMRVVVDRNFRAVERRSHSGQGNRKTSEL